VEGGWCDLMRWHCHGPLSGADAARDRAPARTQASPARRSTARAAAETSSASGAAPSSRRTTLASAATRSLRRARPRRRRGSGSAAAAAAAAAGSPTCRARARRAQRHRGGRWLSALAVSVWLRRGRGGSSAQPECISSPSVWPLAPLMVALGKVSPVHGSAARLLRHLLQVAAAWLRPGARRVANSRSRPRPHGPCAGPCWSALGRLQECTECTPCAPEPHHKPVRRAAGPVQAAHAYVDMSRVRVAAGNWTRAGRTCPPAMGFSFAAGTTDGAPHAELHGGVPLHRRRAAATWVDQQRRGKRVSVWLC
jgi:hypothetical protein